MSEHSKNLKILIVEDDSVSGKLLEVMVDDFSQSTLKVRTGFEAVEVCRLNPDIDLILMDIKMPKLDGYVATQMIRDFNKDVVIIAQTAYVLFYDRGKALDVGCNDYIAKPFRKKVLGDLINKYFPVSK